MQLVSAIVVFLIANYLKLLLLLSPLCSIWRYLSSSKHAYIILAELALTLAVVLIMFVSLVLAKMDCQRLANYFLLPVSLGVAYLQWSAHKRVSSVADLSATHSKPGPGESSRLPSELSRMAPSSLSAPRAKFENADRVINDETGLVDSLELALGYGLGALVLLHLASNLSSLHTSRSV